MLENFDSLKKNIILIADDNHIINESNKRLVKSLCKDREYNYDILTCNDGMEILKIICDEKYYDNIKIIITDENMEFINGSEAIGIIRLIEERKRMRAKLIISITSHEESAIINNIKDSGANFIISKPLTKQKLSAIFPVI